MEITRLLDELADLGVSIMVDEDDKIHVDIPINERKAYQLMEAVKQNKSDILRHFRQASNKKCPLMENERYRLNNNVYTVKRQNGNIFLVDKEVLEIGVKVMTFQLLGDKLFYSENIHTNRNNEARIHQVLAPTLSKYKIGDFIYHPDLTSYLWFFDVEVYPNFFSALFLSSDGETRKEFIIFAERDDRQALRDFLNRPKTLVGFNNLQYDNVILNGLLTFPDDSNILTYLYRLSCSIINDGKNPEVYGLRYMTVQYRSIDLMAIRFSSLATRKSLKKIGISLQWPKIQDLPYLPETNISEDEAKEIVEYNWNDVALTACLYEHMKDDINLRREIGKQYHADVINASNSKMGEILLSRIYEVKTGRKITSYYNTHREVVFIGDCIGANIRFETDELKQLRENLGEEIVYREANFKYKRVIEFADLTLNLGVGGLHSKDKGGIFETDDDGFIVDCDVSSFYPHIILNNPELIYPEHLGPDFINVYHQIVDDRMEAKTQNDVVKSEALKITINSVFGKFKSAYAPIYDVKCSLAVTVSGQLYLLSLIERLHLAGIKIISVNTDGILCKVQKFHKEDYERICQDWMKETGFQLEFTAYERYIRRDVNNYLAVGYGDKIKRKGIFETDIKLEKAYNGPIIAKALNDYYLQNKPVLETLQASQNIHDFILTPKVGGKFITFLEDEDGQRSYLQKTNRVIVSLDGGRLFKEDTTNEDRNPIAVYKNRRVTVVNDISEINPERYNIDMEYYVLELEKTIKKIDG